MHESLNQCEFKCLIYILNKVDYIRLLSISPLLSFIVGLLIQIFNITCVYNNLDKTMICKIISVKGRQDRSECLRYTDRLATGAV